MAAHEKSHERPVLVTGVPGNIGSYFVEHAPACYRLRMLVQRAEQADALRPRGEVIVGDLSDPAILARACAGVDTILHLAANPSPSAEWAELLQPNIIGLHNLFDAAVSARCRRVVFASSIHAVFGYPADRQVKTTDPVNPMTLYGVSKCFGEALARYFAEQRGLSVIVMRIGAFQPVESLRTAEGREMADIYVSPRDLFQLIRRCIDDAGIGFAIVHGLSGNRTTRLDLTDTRERLGYAPEDDAFALMEDPPP